MKLLNIIKKIVFTALGVLLLFELLGIKTDVFAAESGYYKSTYDTYYIDCATMFCGGENDTLKQTGFIDLGTSNTIKEGYYTARVQIRTLAGATSNTWYANNTYTFRYTFNLNSEYHERIMNYKVSGLYANTSSSNEGSSNEYISSYSYKWEEGSVEGRYLLYVTFIPKEDIKYLSINLYMPNYNGYREPVDEAFDKSFTYSFLKVTYSEGTNAFIEYQTEVIQQQTEKINQSIENMMNIFKNNGEQVEETLTDDTPPTNDESSAFVDGMVGFLPPGPLDSILNLPLTILNNYYDALNGNCQPINVPLPFVDEDLPLECPGVLVSKINGVSDFLSWIGLVASVIMVYSYLLHLYNWTDKVLTLEHFRVPGYYDEP